LGRDDITIFLHERYCRATERDQHVGWRVRVFAGQKLHAAVDVRLTWEAPQVQIIDENFEALARSFTQTFLESGDGAECGGLRGTEAFEEINAPSLIIAGCRPRRVGGPRLDRDQQ